MCGAVHCSDIGIVGIHRKPPMIDDQWVDQLCEIPLAVAACPTAAVRPVKSEHDGQEGELRGHQAGPLHVLR